MDFSRGSQSLVDMKGNGRVMAGRCDVEESYPSTYAQDQRPDGDHVESIHFVFGMESSGEEDTTAALEKQGSVTGWMTTLRIYVSCINTNAGSMAVINAPRVSCSGGMVRTK